MNTPTSGLLDGQQGLAKAYPGGRAQAESGSANIQKHYQALTEVDPGFAGDSAALVRAWTSVEEHGLMDGPASAAERYRALSDQACGVADNMAKRLPLATLTLLLERAMHADKHAIRLHNTAVAIKGGVLDEEAAYGGLPIGVAAAAMHGHTEVPQSGVAAASATTPGHAVRPKTRPAAPGVSAPRGEVHAPATEARVSLAKHL
jgi:hypothetical protein